MKHFKTQNYLNQRAFVFLATLLVKKLVASGVAICGTEGFGKKEVFMMKAIKAQRCTIKASLVYPTVLELQHFNERIHSL